MTLWERLAEEEELLVELGSDQTSLHNPYNGGYYPVQISFEVRAPVRSSALLSYIGAREAQNVEASINSACFRCFADVSVFIAGSERDDGEKSREISVRDATT